MIAGALACLTVVAALAGLAVALRPSRVPVTAHHSPGAGIDDWRRCGAVATTEVERQWLEALQDLENQERNR